MTGTEQSRPAKKRPRKSPHYHRLRELERNAARRTLNGNGMNGSLPPLPVADDDDDDDECDDAGGGGGDGMDEDGSEKGGFGTLFGHPYGALPYGNIHLAAPPPASSSPPIKQQWHPDTVRHTGLGPLLRQLNDEQVLSILSFCDGPSLCGAVTSSRFLYVAGHHEELWRDLALRRWGEEGFTVPSPDAASASCNTDGTTDGASKRKNTGCWKDIYAYNHHHNKTSHQSKPPTITLAHDPMPMSGIYSDTFFRSWLCRSFALQPSWLSTHTVPTLPHHEVTTSIFVKEYEEKNIPLLIKGASKTWPALAKGSDHKWNSEYLLKTTANKTFRATSGAAPLPASFSLSNYLKYCTSSTEEAPLYLFDRTFATKVPQLLEDFDGGLKDSCAWWKRGDEESGHDLFSVLGEGGRPDYQWLIVGPKRSGSCFHIDPNCTHAWNAPIIGRKRWIFYPPGVTPPGVFPSPSGDDVCMPISIGEWFLTFWDAHVERRKDPDVARRPLECTAYPGDVLFVPHGWWHMVLNIGDDDDDAVGSGGESKDDRGVSVALTRNYVSASNLSDVLRFLDTRVSQISGCRDRKEAVPPEELGREFRRALLSVEKETNTKVVGGRVEEEKKCDESQNNDSDRGKWVDLLERAEKRSKEGWGCGAWVDLSTPCTNNNSGLSNDSNASNEEKQRSATTGSSILARAKQQSCPTEDAALGANRSGTAATSSSSGGFSFSFL